MPVRIGELLLKEKRISAEQLQEALNYQRTNGGKLGANLVKLGYVKDEEITALLSKQYGVPSIALNQFEIDPAVIKLVPSETARKYQIVPLSRAGATLTIAMTDPTNVFAMDDIKFMTGYNVEPVVASETAVLESIEKYYGTGGGATEKPKAGGPVVSTPVAPGASALEVAAKQLDDLPTLLENSSDGTVEVRHGWTEMGQGVHTVAMQVAIEELGLDPATVVYLELEPGDLALWTLLTVPGSLPNESADDRAFAISSYVRADTSRRGEWAFLDGVAQPLGDTPQVCKDERLHERLEPHYDPTPWYL